MHVNRTKILLIGAMALALVASWLAYSWVQERSGLAETPKAEATTVSVVVANVEIPYGIKIEAAHLKTIKWPVNLVQKDTYKTIEEVVDKIATLTIFPEDIITTSRIADSADGSHLAALISPNKRAITVRVDDVIGVGGFLLPGNHVDVIGVRRITGTSEVRARTVMRDVVVLAVDQDIAPDGDKPKVVRAVTLEMLASSAVKVIKAANEGKIHLLLRNPADKFTQKKGPVIKKKKPASPNVNIIRGTTQSKVKPSS